MDHNDVKRAVVVGAGVMGHSIAHVFAQSILLGKIDVVHCLLQPTASSKCHRQQSA